MPLVCSEHCLGEKEATLFFPVRKHQRYQKDTDPANGNSSLRVRDREMGEASWMTQSDPQPAWGCVGYIRNTTRLQISLTKSGGPGLPRDKSSWPRCIPRQVRSTTAISVPPTPGSPGSHLSCHAFQRCVPSTCLGVTLSDTDKLISQGSTQQWQHQFSQGYGNMPCTISHQDINNTSSAFSCMSSRCWW